MGIDSRCNRAAERRWGPTCLALLSRHRPDTRSPRRLKLLLSVTILPGILGIEATIVERGSFLHVHGMAATLGVSDV